MSAAFRDARTLLFVPGDRPSRFTSAAAARPDVVVLDLEDAVAEPAKDAARENVARVLRQGLDHGQPFAVRVNAPLTAAASLDRELFGSRRAPGFAGILVPKAEEPEVVEAYADGLGTVVALIESAVGVRAVSALAESAAVARLALGGIDLALDLGLVGGDAELEASPTVDAVRARLVVDSRIADLPAPFDGVSVELSDGDAVQAAVRRARLAGLTGKLCIHPRQVAWVHEALAPRPDEIAWARAIVAADGGAGAISIDGRMVDRPVMERAARLLARAGEDT
jgi:citrate lyase beta subunit